MTQGAESHGQAAKRVRLGHGPHQVTSQASDSHGHQMGRQQVRYGTHGIPTPPPDKDGVRSGQKECGASPWSAYFPHTFLLAGCFSTESIRLCDMFEFLLEPE